MRVVSCFIICLPVYSRETGEKGPHCSPLRSVFTSVGIHFLCVHVMQQTTIKSPVLVCVSLLETTNFHNSERGERAHTHTSTHTSTLATVGRSVKHCFSVINMNSSTCEPADRSPQTVARSSFHLSSFFFPLYTQTTHSSTVYCVHFTHTHKQAK